MSVEINFGEYSLLNDELYDYTECNDSTCEFYYPCDDKEICSGFKLNLKPGHYFFEVYGAQGSQEDHDISESQGGGLGGYARAEITIRKKIPLYLFIGSQGDWTDEGPSGKSFNGGGPGYNSGPGGGATDFRMFENEIRSRFLIAGGGGAQGVYYNFNDESDLEPEEPEDPEEPEKPDTDPELEPEKPDTDPELEPEKPDTGSELEPEKPVKPDKPNTRSVRSGSKLREIEMISYPGGYGWGDSGANGSFPNITGGTQYSPGDGFLNGYFGRGCAFHSNGTHGGSGGGLFGGGCGKNKGASGAEGSGFVYSDQRTDQIFEIKDIEIKNGYLTYGINQGDGFARITLLSPIKLTEYHYNFKNKKINTLTIFIFINKK
ncbi:hypothetical protein TVAG_034420 [Trichomonas vaginalis G3]|uniref:receptor protein-tyrosine kinase n=1 Tax=Trichomonas vaginalis (strain ATCC PRA-98 / G3) TaxID=412133 RepID=A2EM79_TRIV3|nr:glycine-rich protein family [Trichomonas vaginalis G3]EAY06263.1 hypothetical protein TVAG_034420 [Trichomonas vaginalis G3]KAI5505147.1 glycine-rich protein family [Trichomonas vaginalis G3]|eukprot:XP_001318486.1 hypothetical protein [Trichomonas vaginalis G3]